MTAKASSQVTVMGSVPPVFLETPSPPEQLRQLHKAKDYLIVQQKQQKHMSFLNTKLLAEQEKLKIRRERQSCASANSKATSRRQNRIPVTSADDSGQ